MKRFLGAVKLYLNNGGRWPPGFVTDLHDGVGQKPSHQSLTEVHFNTAPRRGRVTVTSPDTFLYIFLNPVCVYENSSGKQQGVRHSWWKKKWRHWCSDSRSFSLFQQLTDTHLFLEGTHQ